MGEMNFVPRKNIVWIASYPKSGNTWMRSILQCATQGSVSINNMGNLIPSFNGCVERVAYDRGLRGIDDPADLWADTQRWISSLGGNRVIKTHNMCGTFGGAQHPLPEVTHSAIHIVRDPRDVAVSYANHYGHSVSDAAVMLQREDNLAHEAGHAFRKAILGSWQMNVTSWLEAPFPVLTLRYEDMLQTPHEAISQVVTFLKMTPAVEIDEIVRMTSFKKLSRMERADGFVEKSRNQARFFNKGVSGQWHNHKRDLQPLTEAFAPLIEKLGYEI